MKINEVIRKYRKEANLTQEQVANYLGVTAPAVNKWENGISYPDITLLAPLARILKTNVDTLLSFQEELTPLEINQFLLEVSDLAQTQGFQAAFQKGESIIKEYPCCDALTLYLAQILDMNLAIQSPEDGEKCERKLTGWYELAASSEDQNVAVLAQVALVNKYREKADYERAQQLLDQIPSLGFDKRPSQASLFLALGKEDAAYEIYEQLIYQNAVQITSVLLSLLERIIRKGELEKAEEYGRIIKELARLLDLGTYIANTPEFYIGLAKEDKERSLDALEAMVTGYDSLYVNDGSDLYSHRKRHQTKDSGKMMKEMIKRAFQNEKEFDLLRGEKRFQILIKQLDNSKEDEKQIIK